MNRMARVISGLIVVVVASTACSGSGKEAEETKLASCHTASEHYCIEYTKAPRGWNILEQSCTDGKSGPAGVWSKQPCASAEAVATCTKDVSKIVYYSGTYTAVNTVEAATKNCERTGGTYKPL